MKRIEGLLAIVGDADLEAVLLEEERDGIAAVGLVVDDEDGVRVIGHAFEASAAAFEGRYRLQRMWPRPLGPFRSAMTRRII